MRIADASKDFFNKISYLSKEEKNHVEKALKKAIEWHYGQNRDSGEPYIVHPIGVASILAGFEAGEDTLIAALLHDIIEDERATKSEVEKEFGKTVTHLVEGVTKLSKMNYADKRHERQLGSLRKLLLTASDDIRVIIIKLADRLNNIRTLDALNEEKRIRIAKETLDVYVPFARLFGFWNIKSEYENICFPIAYPEEYKLWDNEIKKIRKALESDREDFVETVNTETTDDVNPILETMTDYQIFSKLKGSISLINDETKIDSVQIILQGKKATPTECYRVLGQIHEKHSVESGSFRDYISTPQPNGYMALHTTIFLKNKSRIRLRIQTEEMNQHVSNRKISSWTTDRSNDIYKALESLSKTPHKDERYMKDVEQTLLNKRINVFTTSGEIITLPRKATGVDFAFAVDPNAISFLVGIVVNGEMLDAGTELRDGDIVEIELLKNKNDVRYLKTSWLDKVKSIEAREALKGKLKKFSRNEKYTIGINILENEMQKHKLSFEWLLRLPSMQKELINSLQVRSFDLLIQKIGSGEIGKDSVLQEYMKLLDSPPSKFVRILQFFHLLPQSRILNRESKIIDIQIEALDRPGMIFDISRCFLEREINIAQFGVFAVPPRDALYKISLEADDFGQFSDLFDSLLQIPTVKKVIRKK
ncbi:MAG: bifunctional (p)ppGpp synthetase/guanosine-3',5'-bis(diphosphate) 3'-pyrophosphohydrolase [Candidatus Peribacteraceae bacterium]|nr:bifunctional (p)ppGpp synthetase/guanosine-3',5'-bis(diphosphate) 3'-pyrophosphohydrolase [Candidatus Peribacteraceae bacterium]